MICRQYIMGGLVQGVGFRPFVHNLAEQLSLKGWVQNNNGRVSILVEGDEQQIQCFEKKILFEAPPLAKPTIRERFDKTASHLKNFIILSSDSKTQRPKSAAGTPEIHLPADLYTCPDCQWELLHPGNARYQYAFINCTQCGPRYTIIDALPYDRNNTAMRSFPLCETCGREYNDSENRRFHAEPLACPECGPQLQFLPMQPDSSGDIQRAPLVAACEAINEGKIIAVKGIGGFHLVCDAHNEAAIGHLRSTKPRPDKPLAVMLSPETLGEHSPASELHIQQLVSAVRPVVLCPKHPQSTLPPSIAPGLNDIGIIFPYSPLHFMLMDKLQKPLVVTSANISGEPVFTESDELRERLSNVINGVLDHNRPIRRPADDSVIHIINNQPQTLRIGRGLAPLELSNPYPLGDRTLLATGAHSKNTLCLAFGERIVVSPHIADMDSLRSQHVFEQLSDDFCRLYQQAPSDLAHDAHPDYTTSRWAAKQNTERHPIWHHHAHASSLYAINGEQGLPCSEPIIAFTWDGTGLGCDGTLWGGDCLSGKPANWQRQFYFKPFKLPGGEKASREPWRIADSLRLHCGLTPKNEDPLLYSMWQQNINTPSTTAVGRFLDGCAALLNVCEHSSYEGQAPMQLQALAERHDTTKFIDMPIVGNEVLWLGLVKWLIKRKPQCNEAARVVHNSLAHSLVKQACLVSKNTGISTVAISGGVFQNSLLVEQIARLLPEHGLKLYNPGYIPVNDGGLCIGQVIEAAARMQSN